MTNFDIGNAIHLMDSEFALSPTDDLKIILKLMERNSKFQKDYLSFEDNWKNIKYILEQELEKQSKTQEQLKEIYDEKE